MIRMGNITVFFLFFLSGLFFFCLFPFFLHHLFGNIYLTKLFKLVEAWAIYILLPSMNTIDLVFLPYPPPGVQ